MLGFVSELHHQEDLGLCFAWGGGVAVAFQISPSPGGGNFSNACGEAPGGDPSCEIDWGGGGVGNPGNLTITEVRVNGRAVDSSNYTIFDDGTSSPEIVFHTGYTPEDGDEVCFDGVTTSGDQEWPGEDFTVTW